MDTLHILVAMKFAVDIVVSAAVLGLIVMIGRRID